MPTATTPQSVEVLTDSDECSPEDLVLDPPEIVTRVGLDGEYCGVQFQNPFPGIDGYDIDEWVYAADVPSALRKFAEMVEEHVSDAPGADPVPTVAADR